MALTYQNILKSARQLLVSGLLGLHTFAATPQTITFPDVPYQIVPGGPITLAATASSGLPVNYGIVSPEGVATLNGSTVTLTGTAGSVTLKASQAGSDTFDPAPDVYRTFAVGLSSQRFVKVARGHGDHSVGIRADGTLWSWGYNTYGQLGHGWPAVSLAVPVKVGSASNWAAAACGLYHTVAVQTDGTLWAWGRNVEGQVGDGTGIDRDSPVPVDSTARWTTVACGHSHTVAVRTGGTLWAWGANNGSELGDGTFTQRNSPVRVGTSGNWAASAAGTFHTAAIKTDGTPWAWGSNYYGQIAGGSSTDGSSSPLQVVGAGNWAAVACGDVHTVALKTDRTLWTCGANGSGQIGDGTTTERRSLVQVGSGSDWAAVAGGSSYTMAIKTDGTLWAWGYNRDGQLGDGSRDDRHNPVQVGTDRNWTTVACGYNHTVALKGDGSLWVWGYNHFGVQGVGPTPSVLWPARAPQSLTFPGPGNLPVGRTVALSASVSSGLPVNYVVTGPATLTGNILTPTAAGTLRITAYHQGDFAWWRADSVTQTVMAFSAGSPYSLFHSSMTTAGLSGPDATPNATPFGDRVPNLLKYAFNLNLSGADARTLVPGTGTGGLPAITLSGSETEPVLRVEFLRRIGSGLLYTPKKTTDVAAGPWLPLSDVPEVLPIDAQWERVILEERFDAAASARLFVRLEVTLP